VRSAPQTVHTRSGGGHALMGATIRCDEAVPMRPVRVSSPTRACQHVSARGLHHSQQQAQQGSGTRQRRLQAASFAHRPCRASPDHCEGGSPLAGFVSVALGPAVAPALPRQQLPRCVATPVRVMGRWGRVKLVRLGKARGCTAGVPLHVPTCIAQVARCRAGACSCCTRRNEWGMNDSSSFWPVSS
jgi:hypothetical protein